MMRWLLPFVLVFSSVSALPRVPLSQVATTNTDFAISFYREFAKSKSKNNFIFSPYAISASMAMAYLGASEETQQAIMNTMNFPLTPMYMGEAFKRFNADFSTDDAIGLAIAMWVQKGNPINPEFSERVQQYYEGYYHEGDFEIMTDSTRNDINSWVSKKTYKSFPFFMGVSDVPRSLKILLVASVTLQASWQNPFKMRETKTEEFFAEQTNQRKVPMMTATGEYAYFETEDLKVLEVPYALPEGPLTRLGFWIVLPNKVEGLKSLEAELSIDKFMDWTRKAVKKNVTVKIPRFRLNEIMRVEDTLQKMGLTLPFSQEANFKALTDKPMLISRIFQKIAFQLSETGSNPKRNTYAMTTSVPPEESTEAPLEFFANRPFLFFVYDNSSSVVLFMGRITQP